ncbi:hypothetical protein BKA64DRAFT_652710 [Cadophora sp. MPI-SDFR-AT-0126]|nr:hypothetical protein BKA64DRAFT_652710 [Leotiomycetes sp. MPI-SDFR-AT-0126]
MTNKKETSKKTSRRGRRTIQDSVGGPTDEESLRKQRARLAQRTYRNRKETEVNNLKAQVETLQSALKKTVKSFTKFQEKAIKSDSLAPAIALELSRTAIEIASLSHATHSVGNGGQSDEGSSPESRTSTSLTCKRSAGTSENTDPIIVNEGCSAGSLQAATKPKYRTAAPALSTPIISQPSSPIFPWTATQRTLTFTQRFRLACVERGVQLLSEPNLTLATLHPVFSLHLSTMTIEDMRYLAERSLFQKVSTDPYGPQSTTALAHPSIFRTVEGDRGIFIGRPWKREAESLAFGYTRTVVDTWLPGFEGEWLEPLDVKEYLEGKRVSVGDGEMINKWMNAVLDLYRLIEYLALRAICIGLGPGVRKADVDRALDVCLV